jgi:hypothetical protein
LLCHCLRLYPALCHTMAQVIRAVNPLSVDFT